MEATTGGVETSGSGPENFKEFTSFDANLAQDERDCVFGVPPRRNIVASSLCRRKNKRARHCIFVGRDLIVDIILIKRNFVELCDLAIPDRFGEFNLDL